jgi:RNA polymerase sigma factor (sigma-70 family)
MTPLLARNSSPDRQFERIYQRHSAEVYRYALAVLRNPHDAEDVTQTTFMNAYRSMQNGERPETPKNWLIAIAHNVCRQRFRQAQRRPQESELFDEWIADEPSESEHSAEDIQRALGYLAFNQRAALVMRELEGRSYAEIGEVMGLTVAAVETVIFRARRALREQLEGTIPCSEAELFLSKQLDGELPRADRGPLRAHLRECTECAQLARSQRASRGALKALLGGLPVPASFFGGGSGLTLGLAAKAAAVVCAGAVVGTGGYEATKHIHAQPSAAKAAAAAGANAHRRRGLVTRSAAAGAAAVAVATLRGSPTSAARAQGALASAAAVRRAQATSHGKSTTAHAVPVGTATVNEGKSGTAHTPQGAVGRQQAHAVVHLPRRTRPDVAPGKAATLRGPAAAPRVSHAKKAVAAPTPKDPGSSTATNPAEQPLGRSVGRGSDRVQTLEEAAAAALGRSRK